MTVVLLVIVARSVAVEEFAIYSYILTVAALATVLLDSGVAAVAGREVASGRSDVPTAYRRSFLPQLCSGGLACAVVVSFGLIATGPGVRTLDGALAGLFTIANAIVNLQGEILRGKGRPWTEASVQSTGACVQLVGGLLALHISLSATSILVVLAGKECLAIALNQCFLPKPISWVTSFNNEVWSYVRPGLWLGVSTAGFAIMFRSSQLLLAQFASPPDVALYGAAGRFLDIFILVAQTLSVGLLPSLSRTRGWNREVGAIFGLVGCLGLICGLLGSIWAGQLLTLIFGARFVGGESAATVQFVALPFVLVIYCVWGYFVASGRERTAAICGMVGATAAVFVGFFIYLRPTAYVAAIGNVAAIVACAIACLLSAYRTIRRGAAITPLGWQQ